MEVTKIEDMFEIRTEEHIFRCNEWEAMNLALKILQRLPVRVLRRAKKHLERLVDLASIPEDDMCQS